MLTRRCLVSLVSPASHSPRSSATAPAGSAPPLAGRDDGVTLGSPKSRITVDVYVDLLCPSDPDSFAKRGRRGGALTRTHEPGTGP
jgi:hypothetical protein